MQQENLVELVTREILRRLETRTAHDTPTAAAPQILALVTGGTIGLEEGLSALAQLRRYPADISAVLSPAAEKVVTVARLQENLGTDLTVVTAADPFPGRLLRSADLVVVPVLTQNTAAKLACAFSDTLVTTLVLQALLLGKQVIMAANAADPNDNWRAGAGMGHAPPGLARALQDNLRKIEGYGVRLVDVRRLAEESRKYLDRKPSVQTVQAASAGKVLIDAAAVKAALADGSRRIHLPPQAIVTPLAVDAAREMGISLVREETGHS